MTNTFMLLPLTFITTHRVLLKNFFWRSINIFGRQGITFLLFFITARFLDPVELGHYTYALTILYLIASVGDFGVSTAVTKQVSELIATKEMQRIKALVFNGIILIICLVGFISLLLITLSSIRGVSESLRYVLLLLPSYFLAPLTSLYDGVYRGKKRFKSSSLISLVIGFLSLVILFLLIQARGLYGSLIAHSVYYAILLISLIFFEREVIFKLNFSLIQSVLKYSLIIGIANLSYFLYSRVDIIILKYYGLVEVIGIYEASFKVVSLLLIPFAIVSQVISPDVAKWHKVNRVDVVYQKAKRYTILTLFSSFILVSIIIPISSSLLGFLLPLYSKPDSFLLNALLITFMFQAASYVLGNGFSIFTGDAKLNAVVILLFGLINVVLNYILISVYGMTGLSVTKLIVGMLSNVIFITLYLWKLHKQLK